MMLDISSIPIINYHKVMPTFDIGITTRHPDQFYLDLQIIKEFNYQPVTFKDIFTAPKLPPNPIIITFDDGYEVLLEYAIPTMLEFGFRGIIYIPTDFIGQYNNWDVQWGRYRFKHLNRKQLCELQRSGFEIGSHGISHRPITALSAEGFHREIAESKIILQELLQETIYSLSYPFGKFTWQTMKETREAGYCCGLASIYYRKVDPLDEPYALKRFNIYRFDHSGHFKRKIGLLSNTFIKARDWLIQRGGTATTVLQTFKSDQHRHHDRKMVND